jgi:hypothetical protein
MSSGQSSTFCSSVSSQIPAFTDAELLNKFTSSTGSKGLLTQFDSQPNDSNRDPRTGLLSDTFLQNYVQTLMGSEGVIPTPPTQSDSTTIPKYMSDDENLINQIKVEYCFYESRYFYALDKLIQSLKDGFLSKDSTKKQIVQNNLNNTRLLNLRLNDLIQIVNAVTKQRLQNSQNYNKTVNDFNTLMDKRSAEIKAQSDILNSQNATALLNKEMVKYTAEKNRANANLLSLYSFLNVFALGMLIYIYRST